MTDVTPGEIMVAQAAREIQDGERVFVGMRLPLIAFVVAKRTHAPNAVGLFELGIVRDEPAPELLYTMGDPANVRGATWCARTIDLMGLLARGEVDAGFHKKIVSRMPPTQTPNLFLLGPAAGFAAQRPFTVQ